MEKEFKDWLRENKQLAESTRTNYSNRLKSKIPTKMIEIGFFDTKKSLYDSNIIELREIKSMFDLNNYDLLDWNKSKAIGTEALSALNYLIEYQSEIFSINKNKLPLNQILYGPPGTGKTYNTINKALEIIDGTVPKERSDAKKRFDELRDLGQIEFVTFHQSYGYEEFVEGIKADLESDEIKYKLEKGIFKRLVEKALLLEDDFLDKLDKYIVTLKHESKVLTTTEGNEFTITISPTNGIKTSTNHSFSKEKLNEINKGNLKNNPDYTYGQYIVKDINRTINVFFKNYILIIDEINRGNISKIFGELITLIEPSKRIGEDEELRLTLPNSKEAFGVPSNLYIIGTMNTADRSIAQIDTALRRRFEFVEMMPNLELLEGIVIEGIEVQEVLKAINERIEYIYDREHTIGHSYFLALKGELTKDKLDEIFRLSVIPLLSEYFYGDWADIQEVLNHNNFIKEKKLTYKPKKNIGNKVYEVNTEFTIENYKKIYEIS